MFYVIDGLYPVPGMGTCGFNIKLYPAFKAAVAARGLTQQNVDAAIKNLARGWLDICGYDDMWDPEAPMLDETWVRQVDLKSPTAKKLWDHHAIGVRWGEWGPEHIQVPGNACGLNIVPDSHISYAPPNGKILCPHNVDCHSQVLLLLMIFCWFASDIALHQESLELKRMIEERT